MDHMGEAQADEETGAPEEKRKLGQSADLILAQRTEPVPAHRRAILPGLRPRLLKMLERNMSETTVMMTDGRKRREVEVASLEQDRLLNEGWTVLKQGKPGRRKPHGDLQD